MGTATHGAMRLLAVGAALFAVCGLQGCGPSDEGDKKENNEAMQKLLDLNTIPVGEVKEALKACGKCTKEFDVDKVIEQAGLKEGRVNSARLAAVLALQEFSDKPTVYILQILEKFTAKFGLGTAMLNDIISPFLLWMPLDLKILEEQYKNVEMPKFDLIIPKSAFSELGTHLVSKHADVASQLLKKAADKEDVIDADKLLKATAEELAVKEDKAVEMLKDVAKGDEKAKDLVKQLMLKDSSKVDTARMEAYVMSKARSEERQVMKYGDLQAQLSKMHYSDPESSFLLWVPLSTSALKEALGKKSADGTAKTEDDGNKEADKKGDDKGDGAQENNEASATTTTKKASDALIQESAAEGANRAKVAADVSAKGELGPGAVSSMGVSADGHIHASSNRKERMKRNTVAKLAASDVTANPKSA